MAATSQRPTITAEGAQQAIEAAEQKARAIGVPMCVAVCDESGVLKAFARMDGAALLSAVIAQDMEVAKAGLAALGAQP